jgi:hypothetical protein
VTPLRIGERLSVELPNARLVVYPRCGHFPMIEARHPSTRDLVAFLAAGRDAAAEAPAPAPSMPSAAAAEPLPPAEPANPFVDPVEAPAEDTREPEVEGQ